MTTLNAVLSGAGVSALATSQIPADIPSGKRPERIAGVRIATSFITGDIPAGTTADPYPGSAVQAAIDDLPSTGGKVFVSAGVWSGTVAITVPSGVEVVGAGYGTHVKVTVTTENVLENSDSVGGNADIRIANMRLEGAGAGSLAGDSKCIFFDNVTDSIVEDCWLHDSGDGFEVENCSDVMVRNCFSWNHEGNGIEMNTGSFRISFLGNTAYSNGSAGIEVDGITDALVEGNHCHTNARAGIWVLGSSSLITIVGNVCTDNQPSFPQAGIHIHASSRCAIVGNVCKGNGTGILLRQADGNTIVGNVTEANIRGIELSEDASGSPRNIVAENQVVSNTENGMYLRDSDDNVLRDNYIYDNVQNGLFLVRNSSRNIIASNYVLDNDSGDTGTFDAMRISDGSDENRIEGNISYASIAGQKQRFPIRINNANCDENVIVDNSVLQAGRGAGGVVISDAGTGTVIRRNQGHETENRGTAVIANSTSSIAVAHGLVSTPTVVVATGRDTETDQLRVSARDGTNITLAVPSNVTAARTVDWQAEV